MAASAINLVQIIKQYPCLYDNRIPGYSRKNITDQAWSEVAQKTNTSVIDCQARWKNIRNGFVRSLKPTSSPSAKQKKSYYLHDELQFILPFIKAVIHTGEPTPSQVATEDVESNCSSDEKLAYISEASCSEPETNTLKKRKIREVTNEADKAFADWMKYKESKDDSPRKMFLLSLLPDIENLSEEQMRKFRIKMLLLLEEIQSSPTYASSSCKVELTELDE